MHIVGASFSIGVALFILVSAFNGTYELRDFEVIMYSSFVIANFVFGGWNISVAVEKYMKFQIMLRDKKIES